MIETTVPHTPYKCPQPCERLFCQFCDGGIFSCTVCGGIEGSLTTDCSGKQITHYQMNEIYGQRLDYRVDSWVEKGYLSD